jgi:rhodanese-related sulfurtransferase
LVLAQKGKVLFLDVRTRAEAQFLGMAEPIDALALCRIPGLHDGLGREARFSQAGAFNDFVPEAERRLTEGTDESDPIVLMCRSGERSSRAADLLADSGYTRVYTVVYGFEGELSDKGRRNVNGWKNAGLPWSYELDRKKMYFPR